MSLSTEQFENICQNFKYVYFLRIIIYFGKFIFPLFCYTHTHMHRHTHAHAHMCMRETLAFLLFWVCAYYLETNNEHSFIFLWKRKLMVSYISPRSVLRLSSCIKGRTSKYRCPSRDCPQVAVAGSHVKVRAGRDFQLETRDYQGTPSERGSMRQRRVSVYTDEEEARLGRLCQAMGSAQREEMGRCRANNVLMWPNLI